MPSAHEPPYFSIIIPTRDRSALFERTLLSALAQDIDDVEVIVVNDGSSGDELDAYRALEEKYGERVRYHHLPHRARGHGPSFSRNAGAALAQGVYLCFLDDDDLWLDQGHLRRCRDSIRAHEKPVDLLFTDQEAVFSDGRMHPGPLWISGAEALSDAPADAFGSRPVTADQLLNISGFAHLNCSVYRRAFFESLGGMDETLRYENDRDVYLRAIDAAETMLYNPCVIARHHIPDARKTDNVSTAVTGLEKKIFQLRIFDKAILGARQSSVKRYAKVSKGYALKHMAHTLKQAGRPQDALFYIKESLLISFSFKWCAFALVTALQCLVTPNKKH